MQEVAFGDKDLSLTNGEVIKIPAAQHCKGANVEGIPAGTHRARELASKLITSAECYDINLQAYATLTDRINAYQHFLKHEMLDHLVEHSPIAAHCMCRLLGGQEHGFNCHQCAEREASSRYRKKTCDACLERKAYCTDCPESCGGHAQHCDLCDQRYVIFEELRSMLRLLKEAPGFPQRLYEDRECEKRLGLYIAHLVRGRVEADAKAARRDETDDEDEPADPDEYIIEYYDDISDDKKEDGFSVLSCMQADLTTYKEHNPEITEARITTDGAAVYAGKYLAHCLPLLGAWTGVKILDRSIGEAGMNKSSLDAHFGTASPHVKAQVAAGVGDAALAAEVVDLMHSGGGMKSTTCREVIMQRRRQQKLKPGVLADVPIRSIAYRQFQYAADGTWEGTTFFKHGICGEGKYVSVNILNRNWEATVQGPTGVMICGRVADGEDSMRYKKTEVITILAKDERQEDSSAAAVPSASTSNIHPSSGVGQNELQQPSVQKQKAADELQRKQKRQQNKKDRAAAETQHIANLQQESMGSWCPVNGCNRFFRSTYWLEQHKHSRGCPDGGTNPFRSSRHRLKSGVKVVTPPYVSAEDMIKMAIGAPASRLRATVKRHVGPSGIDASAASELRQFIYDTDVNSSGLLDEGEPDVPASNGSVKLLSGEIYQCPVFSAGACMKSSARSRAKYTRGQLDFLDYAYARGVDHKGAKMSAREAATAMKVFGTRQGFITFGCRAPTGCSCPTVIIRDGRNGMPSAREQCLWKPEGQGVTCSFRAPELLEHWAFRSWFSGQKAAFVSKYKPIIKKHDIVDDASQLAVTIEEEDAADDE
eukprot:scaffold124502_cov35-Prasinocladus_malaysianus.AAC.1